MVSTCAASRLNNANSCCRSGLKTARSFIFPITMPRKVSQLLEAARQRGLEGIVAKSAAALIRRKRSRDWLKIKITQRQECVIGGYTDPEGSREYFGALVLGLYDRQGRLIHVGQVGTGFDHKMLKEMFARLQPLETKRIRFMARSADCGRFTLCAGTGGRNQVCGVDSRNRGRRHEAARSCVYGAASG
jgi:ATP-dependent DNA ligase